jgi:hypothetical protein
LFIAIGPNGQQPCTAALKEPGPDVAQNCEVMSEATEQDFVLFTEDSKTLGNMLVAKTVAEKNVKINIQIPDKNVFFIVKLLMLTLIARPPIIQKI